MRRLLACLCAAVPVLAACGTTVPAGQTLSGSVPGTMEDRGVGQGPLGEVGTGLAPEGTAVGAGALGAKPGVRGGAGGSTGSAEGTSTAAGASGGTTTATGAGAPAASAGRLRGVTPTAVRIGFPVETGTEAAAEAFGIEGAANVSSEAIVKAVVADVNRTGGVLGRKVEPVFHRYDVAEAISNPDRTVAKICADYGQDRPVYAVVFNIPRAGLRKCLAEMGSPLVLMNNIESTLPAAAYAADGGSYLFGINSITVERQAELFIASLHARTFHEKWNTRTGGSGVEPTRFGVIHVDTPEGHALYDAYAKELAKRGQRFDSSATYPNNVSDAFAATQAAVLKFKSEGITHVFGASVVFMQAAEQQSYRPRYAYLPNLGAFGAANAPPAQMRGALTVGWSPARDVNEAQDPGDNPGSKRCRSAMTAAGLGMGNRSSLATMYNYCDGVYAFRDAQTAGRTLGVASLRQGFESLGSGFPTALSFSARLGPGRHHGVDAVRDMAYDSACSCLVYTSRSDRP